MRRLLTLNVYQKNYLDRSIPYLVKSQPDIICLQEVCRDDFEHIKSRLNFDGHFLPTIDINVATPTQFGLAILTSGSILSHSTSYFSDQHESLMSPTTAGVLIVTISFKIDETYTIANTHGVWTDGGFATPFQLRATERLLGSLQAFPNLILCGDFNAPRGREAWERIGQIYQDTIPANVMTTIDGELHRVGPLPYVVDGIFTTPHYRVKDVRVVSGLSDHCALEAEVEINDENR